MSNYQGHLIGGAVTYTLLISGTLWSAPSCNYYFEDLLIWFIMCLLGSLFPDIDIRSKGQKIYYRFLLILTIVALITKKWDVLSLITFAALFPAFVTHRGLMHQVSFIITAPFLAVVALSRYDTSIVPTAFGCYIFFVAGALSHLVLDFGPRRLFLRSLDLKKSKYSRR
jgi:hypothetical protein